MPENKIILCDTSKCNGCRICEVVCSIFKDKCMNWRGGRIRTVKLEPVFNVSFSCRRCEDKPCENACPRGALKFDEKEGMVKVDAEKCNGCGWCIEKCEFGSIKLNPTWSSNLSSGKHPLLVCDFCKDEADGPQCVKYCPKEALSFKTVELKENENTRDAFVRILKGSTITKQEK